MFFSSLTVGVFLWVFGLFFLLYAVYTAFNVYHLLRYGMAESKVATLAWTYAVVSALLAVAAAVILFSFDWSAPLTLSALSL